MKRFAWFAISSTILFVGCSSSSTPEANTASNPPAAGASVAFASVQPIFGKCAMCHGGQAPKEQLDLTSYANIMKGSEHGPVVIAGDPDGSMIMHALKGEQGKKQMPLGSKLPDEEIQQIADWIKAGAKEN